MQTKKMFQAMALTWAAGLSLAVVAVCFAAPEAPSAEVTSTDSSAGAYKQADELAADKTRASEKTATVSADETKAVEEAVAQFYSGLNTLFLGDATAMEQIWSHADDVTYMGPTGGYQIGWQQVQSLWEQQAAVKLSGKVEPKEIHITIGGGLASVQCLEIGNNVGADGVKEEVSIRATSLFRKENGEWKMIGHHTDPLSYLEDESEESED